jgi:hypothetical protein
MIWLVNDDVTGRPDTVLLPSRSGPGSLERPMRHDQQPPINRAWQSMHKRVISLQRSR